MAVFDMLNWTWDMDTVSVGFGIPCLVYKKGGEIHYPSDSISHENEGYEIMRGSVISYPMDVG